MLRQALSALSVALIGLSSSVTPPPLVTTCDGSQQAAAHDGGKVNYDPPPCSYVYCSTNDPNDKRHDVNAIYLNPHYLVLAGKWVQKTYCDGHFWNWVFIPEERPSVNWELWQRECYTSVPLPHMTTYTNIASGSDNRDSFYPFMDTVDGQDVIYGWRIALYYGKPAQTLNEDLPYVYSHLLIPRINTGPGTEYPQNFTVKEFELALCGAVVKK